jgi:uncharacterized protein YoaH (UPF0181 family)
MKQHFPKMIPSPTKGGKDIRVESEEEYKLINPADFQNYLLEREKENDPDSPAVLGRAVFDERERCALIAEGWPDVGDTGQLIAAQIRQGTKAKKPEKKEKLLPPTLQTVMAAGYAKPAAEQIVAEEKRKFDAHEKPYGPNEPSGASYPGPQAIKQP